MHPGKLQPSETSELIERLEDSLMTLGGMATNRYAGPFRGGESLLASCAWSWHRHCSVADTSVHFVSVACRDPRADEQPVDCERDDRAMADGAKHVAVHGGRLQVGTDEGFRRGRDAGVAGSAERAAGMAAGALPSLIAPRH